MKVFLFSILIVYAQITGCGQSANSAHVDARPIVQAKTTVSVQNEIGLPLVDSASIIDTSLYHLQKEISGSYETIKQHCLIKRSEWFKKYTQADSIGRDSILNIAKASFETLLLNGLFHHWYGTLWDFNGYTAIPRQGKIACGYFVSTTLLHMGCKLNRYKMAQQTGLSGAHTLRFNDSIYYFKNTNVESTREKLLKNLPDGLYFVGLSFHVGFLLVRNQEVFFIHSNYIDAVGVMIEKLNYSQAFAQTTGCYVVAVSGNKKLLEKWITNDTIPIITDKDLR